MRQLRAKRVVHAPPERLWALLSEFRHWPRWGPSVRAVEAGVESVRAGTTGRVQTIVGIWLPFVITDVEPGRSWQWRIAGVPATSHDVIPMDDATCRVEFGVAWLLAPYLAVLHLGLRRLAALAEGEARD